MKNCAGLLAGCNLISAKNGSSDTNKAKESFSIRKKSARCYSKKDLREKTNYSERRKQI